MKGIRFLIFMLIATAPAYATAIRIDTESEFLAALENPYLFEDFNQYTYGSYVAPALELDASGYQVVLSAQTKLYSGDGDMSTRCVDDVLVIDFSSFSIPITAIGGYFWPTDIQDRDLVGYTKVVLSDGSVYEIEKADYDTFLGFISTDNTVFSRLEISVLGRLSAPYSWPTVDNLYAGTVNPDFDPVPNPEPSSLLLLTTGLCGIVFFLRRKVKAVHAFSDRYSKLTSAKTNANLHCNF
jgi:hypothetical protein